jgi:hypothetical protein
MGCASLLVCSCTISFTLLHYTAANTLLLLLQQQLEL